VTHLSQESEKGMIMFPRQPQNRFHREATKSTAHWPTPIGRRWSLTCCVFVIVIASHVAGAHEKNHGSSPNEYPGQHWTQVKTPEDRGWSSDKLTAAKAYADSIDTAAVVIVDDGVIISQWGETATKFNVHSIRKSFLSALYGIAADDLQTPAMVKKSRLQQHTRQIGQGGDMK
jgi:hypothetical protein